MLDLQAVEGPQRQIDEGPDAVVQLEERGAKRMQLVRLAAYDPDRIRDPPVRIHRVPGPDRAGLAGDVIAHREDEVELRRIRSGELVPALAAKPGRGQLGFSQHLQSERVYL